MAPKTTTRPTSTSKPTTGPQDNGQATGTQPELCGVQFMRKTPQGKEKQYACTLPAGHPATKKHGLARREPLPEVSLSVLSTLEDVPEQEKLQVRNETGSRERSAEQRAVDEHVKSVWDEWVAAGKPSAFNDSPRKRYMFEPGQGESILSMLRRAERLHGVRVRALPVKRHESGRDMLYWSVTDVKPKTTTTGQSDS